MRRLPGGGLSPFLRHFFIKYHEESLYRVLGMIWIFLIRKKHEIFTSQRVCRLYGALCFRLFVFVLKLVLYFLSLDDYLIILNMLDDYLTFFDYLSLLIAPRFRSRRAVSDGGLLLSGAYDLICFMKFFEGYEGCLENA